MYFKINALERIIVLLIFINLIGIRTYSQVGIGTVVPEQSSILDISASNKGMLTPRMTTVQKNTIASPANGLLVFDTDLGKFSFYDQSTSTWNELGTSEVRDNYKLVKSVSDLPSPSGGKITLDSGTLYEINGVISLTDPIDMNGAYIIGLDTNEDVLLRIGGTIFTGGAGGSIRNITLSAPGGTVFNLNDTGGTNNLVIQSSIIANSGSIGTIQGYNLLFLNIIQFSNNSAGITYSDINYALLHNLGWFDNNGGIYETYTGDFQLIEKVSGFCQVIGATAAMDITGVTTISADAVLSGVVFSGGGNYINGNSPYTGFNFDNDWTVTSPGIPEETDKAATGYIYFAAENNTVTDVISDNVPVKMVGTTTSGQLFRTTDDGGVSDRVKYVGDTQRVFTIQCSATVERSSNGSRNVYSLIVYKNGSIVPSVVSEQTFENGVSKGNFNLLGVVTMNTNDYIEIYVSSDDRNIDPTVKRFNLVIN